MTEINKFDEELKKYTRLLAEADQDLINDHPLLLGTSKLSSLRKKVKFESCPHDPSTDMLVSVISWKYELLSFGIDTF